jgi:negative regulator of sigma E activity
LVKDFRMDELDSKAREHVCALVDGRLPEGELAQILNALLADPQSVQTWHAYHVVGDVLRSPELAPGRSDWSDDWQRNLNVQA